MKNKSFLNKLESLKKQSPTQLEVERKLLPRLSFMGYVMLVCGLGSLTFAITVPQEITIGPELLQQEILALTDEDPLELSPTEVLNFYAISSMFALAGASCFLISWRKKKTLMSQAETSQE